MKNNFRVIFILLFLLFSFYVFNLTEFEPLNQAVNKYFQSVVFSLILTISFYWPKFRIRFFYVSFFLIFLMMGAYLFQRIALSNALASLGIGIMLIVTLSYIPQIIKQGYVEKL